MKNAITVTWLFPDMLNLHGDRGNLMALRRVGALLDVDVTVRRHDDPRQPLDLDTDMLFLTPGELRCLPRVIAALAPCRAELESFVTQGKTIFAVGSSGAVLANRTQRLDGESFDGLGLLDMECAEREQVYGDDLAFTPVGGEQELLGNQIQVMDTHLAAGQAALGAVRYGYGNDGGGSEGARRANIMFTNGLGPLLVKNPRFTARLLEDVLYARQEPRRLVLPDEATVFEDNSAELIRRFIAAKTK